MDHRPMMNSPQDAFKWAMLKAAGSTLRETLFVKLDDDVRIQAFCDRHDKKELFVSVWRACRPDPSAPRNYALYWQVVSQNLEQVRVTTLEICSYVEDRFHAPDSVIDVNFNGGGSSPDASATLPAGMVLLIPPVVFDGRPSPLALTLNYELARQMREDGLAVDVDCYTQEQQFIPLPNTFRAATGRSVTPLCVTEVLSISAQGILALSKRPRPDLSFAQARRVAETSEWFAAALQQAEKHAKRQLQLRQRLLEMGWFVPPCIRRLDWADMSEDNALEACRIISGFYPFIGAGTDEVWYHIRRLDQRYSLKQGARLRAIVAFGNENPAFVGCEHALLGQFCPAGGCFVKELIDRHEKPLLFQ